MEVLPRLQTLSLGRYCWFINAWYGVQVAGDMGQDCACAIAALITGTVIGLYIEGLPILVIFQQDSICGSHHRV